MPLSCVVELGKRAQKVFVDESSKCKKCLGVESWRSLLLAKVAFSSTGRKLYVPSSSFTVRRGSQASHDLPLTDWSFPR